MNTTKCGVLGVTYWTTPGVLRSLRFFLDKDCLRFISAILPDLCLIASDEPVSKQFYKCISTYSHINGRKTIS
jgi:hypothetical protein